MKVGVLGCFWGCAEDLEEVLKPWISLKKQGFPIVLAGVNAQFKEYAELGFPNDDEATRLVLEKAKGDFDFLHFSSDPLVEKDARNIALKELLGRGVDLVWLLDGDEYYTEAQIKNILAYLEQTPHFDYYHIHFDNRILDTIRWEDGFFPPRIFRSDRHGGIDTFTWDNELQFADGTTAQKVVPGIVPKRVAHVLHKTWRASDAEKKIAYHKKHFGYCAFRINPERGGLEFDPSYFNYHGMPLPEMKEGNVIQAAKPSLDVILRAHSTGDFREGAQRLTDTLGGKHELSTRSLRSLVNSLLVLERANDTHIRLTVLDDHSSKEFLEGVKALLALCPFETNLVALEEKGNSASMRHALEYAKKNAKDFIYFVEDDYLHEESELLEMMQSYRIFSRNLGRTNIGLFPVDYSDFYLPDALVPTRVVPGSHRHWRISYSTTATFFLPKSLLESQWQWFIKNPQDDMRESESLNVVWQNHATLFSPIPTLAIHVHGADLLPPFSNWRKLWDTVGTAYEQP